MYVNLYTQLVVSICNDNNIFNLCHFPLCKLSTVIFIWCIIANVSVRVGQVSRHDQVVSL